MIAKLALTERFEVTFKSVRLAVRTPSDQETKWYPLFGVALTALPLLPELRVCGVVPEIVPLAPAL